MKKLIDENGNVLEINEPPKCSRCNNIATKWDGNVASSYYFDNKTKKLVKLPTQFRCDDCDPYNKWFAIQYER